MTKPKTISTLSIAAIALVAAAVPALAQGQSEFSGKNASNTGATSAVEQMIASNLESSAVRKSLVVTPEVGPATSNVARNIRPWVLSAFKGQNNFTSAASSFQQVNFKDAPIDPLAKKQFRADENETNGTRQVGFVPSRGQKLPN